MPKICDEGAAFLSDAALKTAAPANLYLGLYVDPVTEPLKDAVLLDLTEPGVGYGRIALAKADWTISGTDPVQAVQPQKIFTAGEAWGDVPGYFITDVETGDGLLIAVEQFSDGPYDVPNAGVVKVTPKLNWT